MTAPLTDHAPHTAAEAAHVLAREGKHVHLVSDGHTTCLKAACGPEPLPLPDTVRERARLTRLSMDVCIRRL